MGKLGGFLEIDRAIRSHRDHHARDRRLPEFVRPLPLVELRDQGARCMECGVPFCHHGCPLGNLIPDWNDLVYRDRWREAIEQLHRTNNFPEFTGRLCPAPCEAACVLEIREGDAVTIKQIELAIVDRAFEEGWVDADHRDADRSQRRRVGGGPAGLACAQQLEPARSCRHGVRARRGRGWSRPLRRPGVQDREAARRAPARPAPGRGRRDPLRRRRRRRRRRRTSYGDEFDAIVVSTGSRVPRDLPVPGRELGGVHFAMDYLYERARWVDRRWVRRRTPRRTAAGMPITAAGKHVIVIGGGDTGADCVAHAHRESRRLGDPDRAGRRAATLATRRRSRRGRGGR